MRWIHKYEEKIEITTIFDHFKAIYLDYENYSVKCYAQLLNQWNNICFEKHLPQWKFLRKQTQHWSQPKP